MSINSEDCSVLVLGWPPPPAVPPSVALSNSSLHKNMASRGAAGGSVMRGKVRNRDPGNGTGKEWGQVTAGEWKEDGTRRRKGE